MCELIHGFSFSRMNIKIENLSFFYIKGYLALTSAIRRTKLQSVVQISEFFMMTIAFNSSKQI